MIPLQYQALAAVVIAAGGALGGWTVRGWREDAARLEAERAAVENMQRIAGIYGQALDDANTARAADQQQAADDRRVWQRRLRDATRQKDKPLVVCGPGLERPRSDDSGVPVRFADAFVWLWDDGLAIGLPDPYRAARPDRSGAWADLAEPEDLLANVAENGEQCNELRSRLLAVQGWWRKVTASELHQ